MKSVISTKVSDIISYLFNRCFYCCVSQNKYAFISVYMYADIVSKSYELKSCIMKKALPYKVFARLMLVIFAFFAGLGFTYSQTYTMGTAAAANGSTVTTCSGNFYDPGGPVSNYGNNHDITVTFCSGNGGPITFDFGTTFNTQATNDYLEIYDGPTNTSRLIYKISGVHSGSSNKVGQLSSTGTCLTFHFVSNGSTNASGWAATITCTPPETSASGCVGGLSSLFLFKEDFEHGPVTVLNTNIGPPLAAGLTGYTYHLPIIDTTSTSYMVNDSEYAIVKNAIYGGSKVTPRAWSNFFDHTSGNGYMMLVNANYDPDTVYEKTLTGLLPNTLYFVTAWIHTASSPNSINFCTNSTPLFSNIKNANIDFKVFDATNTLAAINSTGNIQPVDPDTWKQYNTYYTTKAGETSFKFQITNRASGGCGNDFALDDIEVRQCPSSLVTLPVKLSNFIAKPVSNNYVAMEWLTSEEVNSNYFIIERSKDGSNWQEVSRIKAGGNSSILRSYNDIDYKPFNGVSYYRLQQVDMDGKTTWSDVKKVEMNTIDIIRFVTAGPNPFTDAIKIITRSTVNEKVIVGLYNMSGHLIKSEEHQSSAIGNTFYMSQLSGYTNGIYIVRLQYPDRIEHVKLLKQ